MMWGCSPSKYIVQAVENFQIHLTEKLNGKYLIPARADNPFPVELTIIFDFECLSSYLHLIEEIRP
jgi:hypothetical protein